FLRVATAITRDEERAHDAVQDGFAAAIREQRNFRGEGPLEAWVWRMVVNAALKQLRPEPPTEIQPSLNGAAPAADPDLRTRIADLPERQRTVLFLRHFADLDYRAIGDVLGISPGPAGATLNAALGGFDAWLSGKPGKPAPRAEQQLFDAANGRTWAAFPKGTKLRELIRTTVGGKTYVLFGFRSGKSICLRLRAMSLGHTAEPM